MTPKISSRTSVPTKVIRSDLPHPRRLLKNNMQNLAEETIRLEPKSAPTLRAASLVKRLETSSIGSGPPWTSVRRSYAAGKGPASSALFPCGDQRAEIV